MVLPRLRVTSGASLSTDDQNKMLLDNENGIYHEETGTLANRIDLAWGAYNDATRPNEVKVAALKFLMYAYNIRDMANINKQLVLLMAERNAYKERNPEFIPGKAPFRMPFDPRVVIPTKTEKYGDAHEVEIKAAIENRVLLDVGDDCKAFDIKTRIAVLTAEERADYRLNIHEGLFKQNGKIFDTSQMKSHYKQGFAAFTINTHGEISIFEREGWGHRAVTHSSLNGGAPVIAAGEVVIENGKLMAINTYSGHYKPSLFHVYRALEHFSSQGIDISEVKVLSQGDPSRKLGVESTKDERKWFVTTAPQIMIAMDAIIDRNVKSIDKTVKKYPDGGLLSYLFQLKDKLIGSTLTKDRAALATKLKTEVSELKLELRTTEPKDLTKKLDQLAKIVEKYEKHNNALSESRQKISGSGRLNEHIASFKEQLQKLKCQASQPAEIQEAEAAQKRIDAMKGMS